MSANCDKSGDAITVRFPNRGSLAVAVDQAQQASNGVSWEFRGQDTQTGDVWDVVVERRLRRVSQQNDENTAPALRAYAEFRVVRSAFANGKEKGRQR
jgi:hypothetical protein